MGKAPFWKTKALDALTREEWEALCDGCGLCCLERVENVRTGEIRITSVACRYLDVSRCRCTVYEKRLIAHPDCIRLTVKNIARLTWLPRTCAYRTLAEGRDLEPWHPLVCGDPNRVHEQGISVRDKAVSGAFVHPDEWF